MDKIFTAISLPEVAADALMQLQYGLGGADWHREENLHITLHYSGDVDRHQLAETASALAGLTHSDFSVMLKGCYFFGSKKPRAVWVGVDQNNELALLQSKMATALTRYGLKVVSRKYQPHVTLGYLKNVAVEDVAMWCQSHGLFKCGPIPISEFHLYASHKAGGGRHYEKLETYSFSR